MADTLWTLKLRLTRKTANNNFAILRVSPRLITNLFHGSPALYAWNVRHWWNKHTFSGKDNKNSHCQAAKMMKIEKTGDPNTTRPGGKLAASIVASSWGDDSGDASSGEAASCCRTPGRCKDWYLGQRCMRVSNAIILYIIVLPKKNVTILWTQECFMFLDFIKVLSFVILKLWSQNRPYLVHARLMIKSHQDIFQQQECSPKMCMKWLHTGSVSLWRGLPRLWRLWWFKAIHLVLCSNSLNQEFQDCYWHLIEIGMMEWCVKLRLWV